MESPDPQVPELTVESAAGEVERFVDEHLPGFEYPAWDFAGRGIVTCAGGRKFQVCAWVLIHMLRRLGCTLPIECWYLGSGEYDAAWADLVRPLGVTCIDAHQVRDSQTDSWLHRHKRLFGWELKPYAIMHSRFQEVLYLDADNVPVVDPTYLFDTPEYGQAGTVFWPDFGRLGKDRLAWKVFGDIPYRDEPEVESGQILLDKSRVWPCLVLCHWYMQNSNNFYFHHVHGDKEVFHLAWRRLGLEYAMPRRGIDALAGTMCQHDFQGQRVFQHRNMRKWTLHGNPPTPGFLYETECLEYLADLCGRWGPLASIRPADAALMAELAGKTFHYWRLGHDDRSLDLEAMGLISRGAARCETFWWIEQGRLVLADENQAVTARIEPGPQGTWYGRWVDHERMPVLLVPEE